MGGSRNQGPFNRGAVVYWGLKRGDPKLEDYPLNLTGSSRGSLEVQGLRDLVAQGFSTVGLRA